MHRLNTTLLTVLLSIIIGVVCSAYISISLAQLISGIIILFLIALGIHLWSAANFKDGISFVFLLVLLSIGTGMFASKIHDPLRKKHHFSHHFVTDIQTITLRITEKLKPSSYQDKYVAHILQQDTLSVTGYILLNVSKDSTHTPLKVGEHVVIRQRIEAVPEPRSPYQFDYGKYLHSRDIYGQLRVSYEEIFRLQSFSGNVLLLWVARFRESVQNSLTRYPFTKRQLAVMNALILGQRQEIDRELNQQYAAAGMMHILAVSGLHVGIILLLLRGITAPLNRRKWKWLQSTLIICFIWAFAIITGLSPSVMRAATMFSCMQLGSIWGGKRATENALIYSAILLLLVDPKLIYHVGFQLSYLAVAAILWIQPWLHRLWKPRHYLTRKLWGIATVTTAAQLGVLPLSLYYFHQFPGLFFISNIVILPFLGLLLGTGILIVVLATLDALPEWGALTLGRIIDTMNHFIGWVASQESFVVQDITIGIELLVSLYILIVALITLLQHYTYKRLINAGCAIILILGIFWKEQHQKIESHFVIFQQSRESLFGKMEHQTLTIYSNDTSYDAAQDYKIKSYRQSLVLNQVEVTTLGNAFRFKRKHILRIDSVGIYQIQTFIPDVIVLSESPKINLNRLINLYPNATIIADGSNYRSYVKRWAATCRKRKIPFHSTYEKGAFVIYE